VKNTLKRDKTLVENSRFSHWVGMSPPRRTDYSPFGVLLKERTSSTAFYRRGFQGQEHDDEVKGDGNSVNFKYRMHDPRVGRFFAVDPLTRQYPHNSPYAFSENRIIDGVELEGKEFVRTRTFDPSSGKTIVNTEIRIQVVNSSKILEKKYEVEEIMHKAQVDIPKIFNHEDVENNTTYQYSVSFIIADKPDDFSGKPDEGFFLEMVDLTIDDDFNGKSFENDIINNKITLGVTNEGLKRGEEAITRTLAHELCHTASLDHPWENNNKLVNDLGNNVEGNTIIKYNLMNSGGNPIPDLQTVKGKNLTKDQYKAMDSQIDSQQIELQIIEQPKP
jgi:RHS repeat-associated protein